MTKLDDQTWIDGGPYGKVLASEATVGTGPHGSPEDCPTYYDGCNCHHAIYDMIYLELPESDRVAEGAD